MSRLARDIQRRKLERLLADAVDEPTMSLIAGVVASQSGDRKALAAIPDLPPDALGAEIGSPYHIPVWSLETLVNELLAAPKSKRFRRPRTRILDFERFSTVRMLHGILVRLENAEDGIFLARHDVFNEVARIAQRQFHWQRGVLNMPHLYRSILLYGSGTAREFFEGDAGLSLPDFVKTAFCMSAALSKTDVVPRERDLSQIGITPGMREAALRKLAIPHAEARLQAAGARLGNRHTGYRPSVLRDFPIIAFGDRGERLRAPIPELVTSRCTSGLYLDVVRGGSAVWTGIGRRFEAYVLEYLQAMMAPHAVVGEIDYGPKKARHRTPDVLIRKGKEVVAAVECKAKRMSFDARFADDPVISASLGFDELAKGAFQIWRFLSHARSGVTGDIRVTPDCQGIIVTADSWLTMAGNQARSVIAAAHELADADGGIAPEDRAPIAFCQIDDVEIALQNGTGTSFLDACRTVAFGENKDLMLSVAHAAEPGEQRGYPFAGRIAELLPWMATIDAGEGEGGAMVGNAQGRA